jgi:AcrR family transcriptional regulator
MQPAKQKRSQERVEKILAVADQILCSGSISDITIANVSKVSELKRTSTYKFFETPDEIKMALIEKYLDACSLHLSNNLSSKFSSEYQQCIMDCCEIIHEFFCNQSGAKKLILENTISPPVPSKEMRKVSVKIQKHLEKNLTLPSMFNKEGVFLVVTQIIFAVLSLDVKETSDLTQVGLNEAARSSHAYLLSCIAIES